MLVTQLTKHYMQDK